jgi:polyisoprenoid-binding protein YceI
MRFATACLTVVVTVALLAFASRLNAAEAPQWNVDHEASRVGFVATQSGDPVPGEFESFDASIRFARDRLDSSSVNVHIRIGSVDAGSGERNQTITSPSLFHAAEHPTARFRSTRLRQVGDGQYIATGALTMRGTTHTVDLPFDLDITRRNGTLRAIAEGALTVQRLRWGIGKGQWKDTSMVPNDVRIEIRIVATRPAE